MFKSDRAGSIAALASDLNPLTDSDLLFGVADLYHECLTTDSFREISSIVSKLSEGKCRITDLRRFIDILINDIFDYQNFDIGSEVFSYWSDVPLETSTLEDEYGMSNPLIASIIVSRLMGDCITDIDMTEHEKADRVTYFLASLISSYRSYYKNHYLYDNIYTKEEGIPLASFCWEVINIIDTANKQSTPDEH